MFVGWRFAPLTSEQTDRPTVPTDRADLSSLCHQIGKRRGRRTIVMRDSTAPSARENPRFRC